MLRYRSHDSIRSIRSFVSICDVAKTGCLLIWLVLFFGCSPPRGVYHTVQSGQTLYRIGQTYKVDPDYLARVNGIYDPSQLKVGKRLLIPGANRRRYVPATATVAAGTQRKPLPSKPASKPSSSSKANVKPVASRVPATSSVKNSSSIKKNAEKTPPANFIWPVHGKLLKPFGQQGYGGRKGVEIEVKYGQNIVAAAAGRVTYSDNGISGYGNLIILKHADDFYTVYGFNKKNLVSTGAYVSKGERIALGGSPPGCDGSRLHFEIRHGKNALNPVACLP